MPCSDAAQCSLLDSQLCISKTVEISQQLGDSYAVSSHTPYCGTGTHAGCCACLLYCNRI